MYCFHWKRARLRSGKVSTPLHFGMRAGDQFLRKNTGLSKQRMGEPCRFAEKEMHLVSFLSDILTTLCWAEFSAI